MNTNDEIQIIVIGSPCNDALQCDLDKYTLWNLEAFCSIDENNVSLRNGKNIENELSEYEMNKKAEHKLVSIFPNPNSGTFNIKFDNQEIEFFELEIYDLAGKQLLKDKLKNYSQ